MPLVPRYDWRQTSHKIVLKINLHRTNSCDVDLVSTASYFKASFPPYCLELFLHDDVDAALTRSQPASDGFLEVRMQKQFVSGVQWPVLNKALDREAASTARQVAAQDFQQQLQQQQQTRKSERNSSERCCVDQQLQLDDNKIAAQRQEKQRLISTFFDDAAEEPNQMKCSTSDAGMTEDSDKGVEEGERRSSVDSTTENGPHKRAVRRRVSEDREYDGDGEDHYSSTEDVLAALSVTDGGSGVCSLRKNRRLLTKKTTNPGKGLSNTEDDDDDIADVLDTLTQTTEPNHLGSAASHHHHHHRTAPKKNRTSGKSTKSQHAVDASPVIRNAHTITVSYTRRHNSLPARESQDSTASQQHATGDQLQDRIAQANSLFESASYSESVSEYSGILEQYPDCSKAYSNRAAAHLANGNTQLAIYDTNKALTMLGPRSPSTDQSRLLCLSRRGAAHVAQGDLSLALSDYEAALAIQPDNASLQADSANIRAALDTSEGSSWVETEEDDISTPG